MPHTMAAASNAQATNPPERAMYHVNLPPTTQLPPLRVCAVVVPLVVPLVVPPVAGDELPEDEPAGGVADATWEEDVAGLRSSTAMPPARERHEARLAIPTMRRARAARGLRRADA